MKSVSTSTLVAVSLAALLGSACATTGLGSPPLDQDLVNDGSPEAQAQLLRHYRVVYEEGEIARPEADAEALGLDQVRAEATTDEAHNYLEGSRSAGRALETIPVSLARFTSSSTMYYGLALGFALAGAGVALAIGLPPMISDSMNGGASPSGLSWLGLSWDVAAGAFTGWVVSWPFMLLNSILVVPFFSGLAAPDYKESVRNFNQDLERKVKKGFQPPGEAQPPETPAPAQLPEEAQPAVAPASAPASAPAG